MWRLERLLAIVLSIVLVFTCARVCQGAAKQKSELSYAERVEMRKRYRPKYARSWEDACGEHELAPSPSGGTVQYGNKPVCLWIWADETNSTEAQRILERRKHSWLWMEEKDTNKAANALFNDGSRHTFVAVGGWHFSGTTTTALMLSKHPWISGMSSLADGGFQVSRNVCPESEGQWLQDAYPSDCACHPMDDAMASRRTLQLSQCSGVSSTSIERLYDLDHDLGFVHSVLSSSLECTLSEVPGMKPGAEYYSLASSMARIARTRAFGMWASYWHTSSPFLMEKSPGNMLRMPFLRSLVPEEWPVKFVISLRHPCSMGRHPWESPFLDMIRGASERPECKITDSKGEVVNQCLLLPPIQSAYCYESRSVGELQGYLEVWSNLTMRGLQDAAALARDSVLFVRFESMESNMRGTIEKICEFLGVPFHEHLVSPSTADKLTGGGRRLMNLHGDRVTLSSNTTWEGLRNTLRSKGMQELMKYNNMIASAPKSLYTTLASLGYHLSPRMAEMMDLDNMPKAPSAFEAAGIRII